MVFIDSNCVKYIPSSAHTVRQMVSAVFEIVFLALNTELI